MRINKTFQLWLGIGLVSNQPVNCETAPSFSTSLTDIFDSSHKYNVYEHVDQDCDIAEAI